jgi:hypothetical protein
MESIGQPRAAAQIENEVVKMVDCKNSAAGH